MTLPRNGFVSNRVLKLNVGYLLSQGPGTSGEVIFDVPALSVAADLILHYLRGTLRLSRTREGILVQGQLDSALDGECQRCLDAIAVPLRVELEELFVLHPHPDAEFTVGEDAILDLTSLLREETLLAVPLAALCRPDCAGLCDQCGSNLNLGPCECQHDDLNPRFAVLLQLQNHDQDTVSD